MSRRFPFIAVIGAAAAAMVTVALAQGGAAGFPDHPIRIIVSVPAGGGVDTITRIVTAPMRDPLGQPLIVENKAGVGGSVAAEVVFNSAPDGYTLLASQPSPITATSSSSINLFNSRSNASNHADRHHVARSERASGPEGFSGEHCGRAHRLCESQSRKSVNYASQGIGTTSHLTAELFQTLTHTKLTHVPYKGTAPAVADLLAGNVDLMFNELATSLELHKSGRAKILAVTTKQRVAALPDIPTLDESGVSGCISDTWHALTAPPKTPDDVVAKLNAAANSALHTPAVLDRFRDLSISPGGGTPAEMEVFVKQETQRWGEVIRDAGIKPE